MKAKEFDFEFTHQRRKFKANLQVSDPFKQKMYRVFVPKSENKNGEVFILYEVKEQEKRFFYFPCEYDKEAMAKSIIRELEKNY